MTKQIINIGTADKGNGDPIRTAFDKVNQNFTELYTALGLDELPLNLGSFEFTGNTITTTDSSSIILDQAVTINSELTMEGDIVPDLAGEHNLGSLAKPWNSLYVSGSTIYLGNAALSVDSNGEISINDNRLVQDNGNYISLNLNVNDVNISSPQVGDTLQWAGGFWVNGTPSGGGGSTAWADITGKPTFSTVAISGSYNDLTDKPNIAGTYQFSVAADDSTQRLISSDEVIKFIGAGSVTTGSDAEGNITITGSTIVTGIESETDVSIKVNLTDSTQRVWRFGEDGILNLPGNLTFPDNTVQSTAWAGGRVVAAPTHSYGADGDVAGMMAFDGSYIYYCTANFVNNSTNIWKRVALDASPW